jgi:hypothetical protein
MSIDPITSYRLLTYQGIPGGPAALPLKNPGDPGRTTYFAKTRLSSLRTEIPHIFFVCF